MFCILRGELCMFFVEMRLLSIEHHIWCIPDVGVIGIVLPKIENEISDNSMGSHTTRFDSIYDHLSLFLSLSLSGGISDLFKYHSKSQ